MFERLLWKEFRALLPLWLGLLAGGLAIVAGLVSTEHLSSAAPLISLAIALAGCFGIAAAATQYAGEVEDGTAGWLRSLPLEGQTVWGAKLLVNVAGSLTLLIVMGALVWLASPSLHRQSLDSALESMEYFNTERMVRFSLGAPFLAAAVSVRLRGVLAAVLVTTLVSGVCAWIASWVSNRGEGPAWVVLAIQTVLAIWLGRQWTIAWCDSVEFAAPRPEALVATRAASSSRSWWDVWCDHSPVWRMWRSLVWQELRRARVFALCWLGLFAVGTALTFLDLANVRMVMLLGYGVATLAGIWSLRGEQRHGFHAFLGDRGIPSYSVWWSKHVVWLVLAILLALPCLLFDAWVEGIPRQPPGASIEYSLSGAPLDRNPLAVRLWTVLARHLPSMFSLYAIGHLASLCCARLVLALATAFVGACAWGAWSGSQIADNGASPWATGALVTAGALFAAGLLVERWLARRSLAWGRGLIVAAACVVCMLASDGFARARYWSLPSDPLPDPLQKELAAMEARMKSPDLEATHDYRLLFAEMSELRGLTLDPSRGMAGSGGAPEPVRQAPVQPDPAQELKPWIDWLERLAAAGEQHASGGRRPLMERVLFTHGGFSSEVILLLGDLSQFDPALKSIREAGDVDHEWRVLLGLLRCARLEKSQGPWQGVFRITEHVDLAIFRRIVDWATLPEVTPERLVRAIAQVREESRGLPPVYEHWMAGNVLARWYLTGEHAWLLRWVESRDQAMWAQQTHFGSAPSGLWKARLERALHAAWKEPWHELQYIEAMTSAANGSIATRNGQPHLHELDPYSTRFNSPLHLGLDAGPVRDELLHAPYMLLSLLMAHNRQQQTRQALGRHNDYRLLLASLTVLHHHKQHGSLPHSLELLSLPVDLFTGQPFEYAPVGLGLPAIGPRGQLLQPDQPVLRSVGAGQTHWERLRWHWPRKPPAGEPVTDLLRLQPTQAGYSRSEDSHAPGSWAKPSPLAVLFDDD